MQLANSLLLPVSQAQAWDALNDTTLLQAAIPGCESITASGPSQYEVVVMAAVGPVRVRFKGRLALADQDPPRAYTIHFEGQGGPAGHGKGQAQVTLAAEGARQTRLSYTAQASVGGKIAQLGSRLVDVAAQKMASDFFERFTAALVTLHGAHEPEPPTAAAGTGPIARLWAWLRGIFGGSGARA